MMAENGMWMRVLAAHAALFAEKFYFSGSCSLTLAATPPFRDGIAAA
jgi:hypothetical protein